MSKTLDVYLHQNLAGYLTQDDRGELSFTYLETYLQNGLIALSLSLPLQQEKFNDARVKAFFSGLLPDEFLREQLARYLGLSEKNAFGLLEVIGGECAGALTLCPTGTSPPEETSDDVEILSDEQLLNIFKILKERPLLAGEDGVRLSLAGAQNKLAVGFKDGNIALIRGSTPTTHILKPLMTGIPDSVYNELFCMRLAKQLNIDVPEVGIYDVGKTPCFIVERYDRLLKQDGTVSRVHQEDICQALGLLPEIKYEREGGPTLAQCQKLLAESSSQPANDQMHLITRVIFNYLIGNADAHGKNFSLIYQQRKPQLAPAYDLLSTAVYPSLSKKMAMKIGGKYNPGELCLRHWHRIVPETHTAKRNLEKQLLFLSEEAPLKAKALTQTLQEEGITSPVFVDILKVIEARAKYIRRHVSKA